MRNESKRNMPAIAAHFHTGGGIHADQHAKKDVRQNRRKNRQLARDVKQTSLLKDLKNYDY